MEWEPGKLLNYYRLQIAIETKFLAQMENPNDLKLFTWDGTKNIGHLVSAVKSGQTSNIIQSICAEVWKNHTVLELW